MSKKMKNEVDETYEAYMADVGRDNLAKSQRKKDADLKWFVEWGNEVCFGHGSYQYSLYRRQCSNCWQELQKLAR